MCVLHNRYVYNYLHIYLPKQKCYRHFEQQCIDLKIDFTNMLLERDD